MAQFFLTHCVAMKVGCR